MGKSMLHTVEGIIKKTPRMVLLKTVLAILFVTLVGGSFWAIAFRINASSTGSALGEGTGTIVGRAVGSLQGITEGQLAGNAAGKKEGLSAKDTTAEIANKIHDMARLEVLVASGTYSDVIKDGPEEAPIYAALLAMRYNAVYTVDFETAVIEQRDGELYIQLEQPKVEFYPVGDPEKKAEYQKKSIIGKTGSAEVGYEAYNNSASQIQAKAKEELQQDESLMAAARESAESQLRQLVETVSLTYSEVNVDFREDVEQ